MNVDSKQMTGPAHAREALRLADQAEQTTLPLQHGGSYIPSADERHRMLLRAHLHASLARTAALTDVFVYRDGKGNTTAQRGQATQDAWHELFDVKS